MGAELTPGEDASSLGSWLALLKGVGGSGKAPAEEPGLAAEDAHKLQH